MATKSGWDAHKHLPARCCCLPAPGPMCVRSAGSPAAGTTCQADQRYALSCKRRPAGGPGEPSGRDGPCSAGKAASRRVWLPSCEITHPKLFSAGAPPRSHPRARPRTWARSRWFGSCQTVTRDSVRPSVTRQRLQARHCPAAACNSGPEASRRGRRTPPKPHRGADGRQLLSARSQVHHHHPRQRRRQPERRRQQQQRLRAGRRRSHGGRRRPVR